MPSRELQLKPAGVAHHEEERRRRVEVPERHLRDQVDAEQVAPQLPRRLRGRCNRVDEDELALRHAPLPLALDAVHGERLALPVELDQDVVLRARAVTPVLGILRRGRPSAPPSARACRFAGCVRARRSAGRASRASSFDSRPDSTGRPRIVAEREACMKGLQRCGRRRDPVAEAAVDDGLGSPEGRERLSALVQVVELPPHELGQHAATPVARHDPDECDAGARRGAAGDRHLEGDRRGEADRDGVVERAEGAVGRQLRPEQLEVVVAKLLCEGDARSGAATREARPPMGCGTR